MSKAPQSNETAASGADNDRDGRFFRRTVAILLIAVIGVVIWRLSQILVVAFGAVLLSLILRSLAAKVGGILHLRAGTALAAVVLLLVVFLGLVGWLFGSQIHTQFEEIAKRLPEIVTRLMARMGEEPMGQYILQQAAGVNLTGATGIAAAGVARFATSATESLGYLILILFAGIYFAAQPARYRRGILALVPSRRRARAEAFLDVAGETLQRWVLAQLGVMVFVGICVGLGLWLLGVRAPFALGLIDGLFTFVPIIGPIVASIPAILLALAQSPLLAAYTVALYLVVHMFEGYLITPLIQSRAISLPPVVTLFAALSFGLLLGPFAVLFAAPLGVLVLVAFGMLYVEDVLGEPRAWPKE